MKSLFYMFVLPVILIAAFLFYTGGFDTQTLPQESVQRTVQETSEASQKWETKTDEQSPVTVTVTPIELSQDTQTWKFQIVFDTHAGSLDDDILTTATLVDDRGNIYQPIAWDGAEPGGHHREGVVVFEAITPIPSSVELLIKNVGGVPERSFMWALQ